MQKTGRCRPPRPLSRARIAEKQAEQLDRFNNMNRQQFRIWLTAFFFIASVATVSIFELIRSYRTAFQVAYTEADLSGYLVSEWISESFFGIEYILKDALYGFDAENILSATRTPQENAIINKRLVQKASFHENIIFLGIFDITCVIQHGSIYSIIGDSSADLGRAYCTDVMTEPVNEMKLSGFFVSSTGDMNVSATYPLLNTDNQVVGFSLAALNLSFFQRWLNSVNNPAITISIMDANQILLARKPTSAKIGQLVKDEKLNEFLQTGEDSILFRRVSPVDGIDRLWSIRRTRDLPFVVAIGYALDDVLVSWHTKIISYVIGNCLVAAVSLFLAAAYHRNRKTAESMETLAMIDPLTGLMNRRSFGSIVKEKLKESSAPGKNAAFIMIDVDHFKAINDTCGHDTGDTILGMIAESLTSNFRSTDLICRWGGEEFLVYMADADLEVATARAARLQRRIAETDVGCAVTVTVSQGIAMLKDGDTYESAIKRADELLYMAKSGGRNCFRIA